VARAAIGLATPLAVGMSTGRAAYGALVSVGALFAVFSNTADAYRMRTLNIAVSQVFGAAGIIIGRLVFGQGWLAVVVVTLVALLSGMISSIGAVGSISGLLLLIEAVLGAGLPIPGPWWVAPLLLSLGGGFVLLLSVLAWPLRGGVPERAAVAGTYGATADLLEAAGTAGWDARRQALTLSLNQAYDLILGRRAREHGRRGPLVRLLAQLNVVIPLVEAAPAAHLSGRPLPAAIPAAVRELADAVTEGRTGDPALELPPPRTSSERALDSALRYAADVVHQADPDAHNIDDRLGRPASLRIRARRATRDVLLSEASWRYGLRLALCMGIAQAFISLVPVSRSYWVAVTVTFILKPDFGSVFSRAVLRALGTVAGLVITAAILSGSPRGWWDVAVVAVLAALIPAVSAKGYAFQTAAVTPVILTLSDVINHLGFALLVPRLFDTFIGCGIALIAGYLLWPESWHTRIGDRLADAIEDAAGYVRTSFRTGDPTPAEPAAEQAAEQTERVRRRRRIYRDLSAVRTEFQRALTEPPPTGERAAAWWPLVVATERIVDAATAARVRVSYGAPPPDPAEVLTLERKLRELAERVRSSETLMEVPGEPDGDESDVLAPLRHELNAARAIASPRGREGPTAPHPSSC
jgi:uncharacterized membrane protein YccC